MASKPLPEKKVYHINYLNKILKSKDEAIVAIDDLIEDIHKDKNICSNFIINHRESDKLIWKFIGMLYDPSSLVVGNAAFLLGTLCELPTGRCKVMNALAFTPDEGESGMLRMLELLRSPDDDVAMNIAGTLGTMAESKEGRDFILSKVRQFSDFLSQISELLLADNLWTGSNGALIIARLSIDEVGSGHILAYESLEKLIINLILCLGEDGAGRGMNAAFALGRILDDEKTMQRHLVMLTKHKIVERLAVMLGSDDLACVKNSCFCLNAVVSTLVGNVSGREKNPILSCEATLMAALMAGLEKNLNLNDDETIWFVVLTLKSMSKTLAGIRAIRNFVPVITRVAGCLMRPNLSVDVRNECDEILLNISPIPAPHELQVRVKSPRQVAISWQLPSPRRQITELKSHLYYKVKQDDVLCYRGPRTEVDLNNLEPNTRYEFYLRLSDELDVSVVSPTYVITTDEEPPTEPCNMTLLATRSTQLKVGWDEPECTNGAIKSYHLFIRKRDTKWTKVIRRYLFQSKVRNKDYFVNSDYLHDPDNKLIETTTDRSSIFSGLQPETLYSISVCAVNNAGKGESASIDAMTLSTGAHAPDKPTVTVLGRFEVNVTWEPPEEPMGKIFRYDVRVNRKETVYSGSNTYCKVSFLKPGTEYLFSVIIVTSEGKYESPHCRKRTAKDEYSGIARQPLYETKTADQTNKISSTSGSLIGMSFEQSLRPLQAQPPRRNSVNRRVSEVSVSSSNVAFSGSLYGGNNSIGNNARTRLLLPSLASKFSLPSSRRHSVTPQLIHTVTGYNTDSSRIRLESVRHLEKYVQQRPDDRVAGDGSSSVSSVSPISHDLSIEDNFFDSLAAVAPASTPQPMSITANPSHTTSAPIHTPAPTPVVRAPPLRMGMSPRQFVDVPIKPQYNQQQQLHYRRKSQIGTRRLSTSNNTNAAKATYNSRQNLPR